MKLFVKLVPLVFGLALIAFALTAGEEGSFANRMIDRAASAFVNNITESAEAREAERVERAKDDVTAIAGWLSRRPGRSYPGRLDGGRFERRGGPELGEGNHLEEYTRTDRGFKLCVRNVSGAWATWVTGPRRAELAASGAMGDCSYRSR